LLPGGIAQAERREHGLHGLDDQPGRDDWAMPTQMTQRLSSPERTGMTAVLTSPIWRAEWSAGNTAIAGQIPSPAEPRSVGCRQFFYSGCPVRANSIFGPTAAHQTIPGRQGDRDWTDP